MDKRIVNPRPFAVRQCRPPCRLIAFGKASGKNESSRLNESSNKGAPHSENLRKAAAVLPWLLFAAPAQATASLGGGSLSLAVGGGLAVAALSATLLATDPAQSPESSLNLSSSSPSYIRTVLQEEHLKHSSVTRRKKQTADSGGDEKKAVASYFNTQGFERWRKIYGETDDVNKVQLDIRKGHAQTVDKVLNWLSEGKLEGVSVCDAGCGTGSLAIPLALQGAAVSASDISSSMANEGKRRYEEAVSQGSSPAKTPPTFSTSDLGSLSGSYDVVTCLDVMIHYPQKDADDMISHLAGLAKDKLIISFAPKTLQYSILKRIGELFPGPAKATRAYLHAEADVEKALQKAGFRVKRRDLTATSFYFSLLMEAERC